MITVSDIWRHPIKSHGREAIETVRLVTGQTMPWDRHWAVTHEKSKFDHSDPRWIMCRNFMIGVATPSLAGIWAKLDEETGKITLTHTDLEPITFSPDDPVGIETFLTWVTPICPAHQRTPTGVIKAPPRGMTDSAYPSVSVMTKASHAAVEAQVGEALQTERWRGNIWLDGTEAWEEFDWTGRTIQIGGATLAVREPIRRCMATAANPQTGQRDQDLLAALRNGWDHQHFGIYTEVVDGGTVAVGDQAKVI